MVPSDHMEGKTLSIQVLRGDEADVCVCVGTSVNGKGRREQERAADTFRHKRV